MKTTACKECGATVQWKMEPKHWQCFDLDGKIHWDNCSTRRWQQVKMTGEQFETVDGKGYRNSVHGTKFYEQSHGWIRGKFYKPCLRKCSVAPWDDCPRHECRI